MALLAVIKWQDRQYQSREGGALKEHTKLKVPGHKYASFSHPTEAEHRTAEQFSWRNSFRVSILTLLAAMAATVFACLGFWETWSQASSAAEANRMNAESGRAWIGPTNAMLNAIPKSGEAFTARVSYGNVGREPAINVSAEITLAQSEQFFDAAPDRKSSILHAYIERCKSQAGSTDGQVAWPTSNSSLYEVSMVNQQNIYAGNNANSTLLVNVCFAYTTARRQRHTASCFFFQPNFTDVSRLNICPGGNYAD